VEERTGITNAQLFVLQQLAQHEESAGPLSIGEVATLARTTAGAVSIIVNRLCRKRLITRKISQRDSRRVELVLTAKGREVVRRGPVPPTARLVDAVDALPPVALESLATGLDLLTSALNLEVTSPNMLFEETRKPRSRGRAKR
jgi:DNA-binding MarR family transcriptional regulator